MLKTRVLTALVLLVLVIGLLGFASAAVFAAVLALVVAVGGWEWGRMGLPAGLAPVLFGVLVGAACFGLWTVALPPVFVALPMAAAWCLSPWLLARWRGRHGVPMLALLLGVPVLVSTYLALVALREDNLLWPWLLLALVAAADIGAYFAGRSLGRRKLAPAISPGKTVEGLLGGLASAALVALVAWLVLPLPASPWAWLALGVVTAAFSVIGDLGESQLKRMAGVKDSGTLLPGHGGVLDRVDGLLAAAPVFFLLLGLAGLDLAGQGG